MSDERWLALLLGSILRRELDGIAFPGFPSKAVQAQYVGSANEDAMREAFAFYRFVKEWADAAGNPIRSRSALLDFGCGWGRYVRLFWKHVDEDHLFACDVSANIIDLCKTLGVPGRLDHIKPRGKLP